MGTFDATRCEEVLSVLTINRGIDTEFTFIIDG
jgi:hypothetical protein